MSTSQNLLSVQIVAVINTKLLSQLAQSGLGVDAHDKIGKGIERRSPTNGMHSSRKHE
ncbi:hypothetical protein [Steroidobacter denitrificans]|uniref:hypothetical protein n=1 Tax=Steroidobacter denitrificans TaxID=465721 RepID=UPI0012ED43ED|nr:hypothetical protein [Steroidobacter denitrificans]